MFVGAGSLTRIKGCAQERRYIEHLEEPGADHPGEHHIQAGAARVGQRPGAAAVDGGALKQLWCLPPLLHLPPGDADRPTCHVIAQRYQLLRFGIRQRAQHNRVDKCKDDDICRRARRKGQQNGDGGKAHPYQAAQGAAHGFH